MRITSGAETLCENVHYKAYPHVLGLLYTHTHLKRL